MIPDLGAMRAIAAKTLTDTCAVTRVNATGPRTVDPVTLELVTGPDALVWAGPCSIRPAGVADNRSNEGGGVDATIGVYDVLVLVAADMIQAGDALTITSVDGQGDPALPGMPLVVSEAHKRTTTILRRLTCVVVGDADGVPT